MNDVAEGLLTFIRWTGENPLPPNSPTRDALKAIRAHLDLTVPGWRERVFESPAEQDAVEVEVHLPSGRVVRGAIVQRASAVQAGGDAD